MSTTTWKGGKSAGCLSVQKDWCQVVFTPSTGIKSKCFSYNQYNSKEEAIKEAKKWRKEMSKQYGLTKNMYRKVTLNDGTEYLEVQLQKGKIMRCELEHKSLVKSRIWTARKSKDKYVWYVGSRASKKLKLPHVQFHNVAYPEFEEVDHIDRDGLNNLRNNVREGKGRINANNKRIQKNNTSGHKGVFFEGGKKPRWRAQWHDENGKKRSKSFSCNRYQNAKEMAINCRNEMMTLVYPYLQN